MSSNLDLFGNVVENEENSSPKKIAASKSNRSRKIKSDKAYRTISEAASELDVATHVLRFWETKFPEIQPMKRSGGRRYYRPEDVDILKKIQHLLYSEGYTIRGVQSFLQKGGLKQNVSEQNTTDRYCSQNTLNELLEISELLSS